MANTIGSSREKKMDEQPLKDLDETRRLVYTIVIRCQNGDDLGAELVATVVNALLHHSKVIDDLDRQALKDYLRGEIEALGNPLWWMDIADAITAELDA